MKFDFFQYFIEGLMTIEYYFTVNIEHYQVKITY